MRNFLIILNLRINEVTGISIVRSDKSKSHKAAVIIKKIMKILLALALLTALYLLSDYIGKIGLAKILPITAYLLALIVTFLAVIISINDKFSGSDDSEFLLSTPVSTFSQVFVTFLMIYIKNLIYTLLIELPFLLSYLRYSEGNINPARWLTGLFMTSLPICGIASLVGIFIILSLAHSEKKNQIISVISIIAMTAACILLAYVMDRIYLYASGRIVADAGNTADLIMNELTKNLKFARFYQKGCIEGDLGNFILFIFISSIWYIVLLFMHTMAYRTTITALRSPIHYGKRDSDRIISMMHEENIKKSLFKKELSQILASKSYLMHIMLGIIPIIVLSFNMLIIANEEIKQYSILIPAIISFFVGLSNISYCEISMEGRQYWIIGSMSGFKKMLKESKIVVNLLFIIPMIVISGVTLSLALHCSILSLLLNTFIPLIYAILLTYTSISIDYRAADCGCESEEAVLNNGISYISGYLPGVIIPALITLIILIWY